MLTSPRVCVIGAGVSGLTTIKALGDWGVDHACFEASDEVGGNWYFRNPNGRSSAYRSLHIDTSKNAISFADFPMDARYPDFPHHTEIKQFLSEYADRFGLRDRIGFNNAVERAERLDGGGWRITTSDGAEHQFDAVLVCNGHHWDPSYPDFPGEFDGPTLHSHHYIDPADPLELTGKRVLVVGIGNSAVDITSELARKGVAEEVFISTRSGAWVIPKYVFGRPADQVFRTNPRLPLGLQRRIARGPAPNLQEVSAALEWLRLDPRRVAKYQALASGRGNPADLGVPVPETYQAFLDLGRFRTALLMESNGRNEGLEAFLWEVEKPLYERRRQK